MIKSSIKNHLLISLYDHCKSLVLLDFYISNVFIFLFPVGAVPNISSILFSISGVISFWYWTALIVYSNCLGLDAPVIAVDTSGFLITHVNANWACDIFNSSANYLNFLNASSVFYFFYSPKNLSWICLKSG